MADNENIVIGVKIETGDATKSLTQLKAEYKDQQKALEGLTEGTAEYVNQLKKLGATKDDIGDLNTTIKSFNPEGKVQAFGSVINGVASGFQAATSAAALFGVESKGVQEALLKVQAASGLAEGVKGVIAMGDSFKVLAANLQTTAIGQKVVAVGQKILTAAQWLWNAAMMANPIGLLIAGIAALVGGIALLVNAFNNSAEAEKESAAQTLLHNKALKENENNSKKSSEELASRTKHIIAMMEAEGLSTDAIRKRNLQFADEKIKLALSNQELAKNTLETDRNNLSRAVSLGLSDEIIAKRQEEVSESTKAYIKETEELTKSYNDKTEIIWSNEIAITKERVAKEKEKKDAIKKLGEEENANYKKKLAEQQALEKAFEDLYEKDKKDSKEAYIKAEKDLIAKVKELKDEEELRLAESEEKKLEIIRDRQKKELQDIYDKSAEKIAAQKALTEGLLIVDGVYNDAVNTLRKDNEDKKKEKDKKDIEDAKEVAAKKLAAEKALSDAIFELTRQSVDSAQALTDIAFKNKLEGVKKGSKEEEAILRKQFEVNKAFQIATAVINGIQGVMAITSLPDPTFGIVTALRIAAQIALTATSIAKIASTKFGGGGGSISGGSVGAGSQGATINAPSTASTMINADGTVKQQPPSQKVYVVESEISTKQKTVATIEENAKV